MAYKRLLDQFYQKRDAYTETLTQLLSVTFWKKNMNTTIKPLRDCLWDNVNKEFVT